MTEHSQHSSSVLWTIDAWCSSQVPADWSVLHESAVAFLTRLGLESVHPHCNSRLDLMLLDRRSIPYEPYERPNVPPQGPLRSTDHLDHVVWDTIVIGLAQTLPPLLAMAELWLRLLAVMVTPLGIAYLLYWRMSMTISSNFIPPLQSPPQRFGILWMTCLWTGVSSLVLCTDTLYVLEFGGPWFGLSLYVLTHLLILSSIMDIAQQQQPQPQQDKNRPLVAKKLGFCYGAFVLWIVFSFLVMIRCRTLDDALPPWFKSLRNQIPLLSSWDGSDIDDHVNTVRPIIRSGLYYDARHSAAQRLVQHWSPESYRYDPTDNDIDHDHDHSRSRSTNTNAFTATGWMPTGDARTGLPFLLNQKIPSPNWIRVWLPIQEEDDDEDSTNHDHENESYQEAIALDISFPTSGGGGGDGHGGYDDNYDEFHHDPQRPLYLVLHGLSGGSQEEYIKDFTWRRNAENSTVVVMIARGLMDVPLRGWNLFHGARIADVHAAAMRLRQYGMIMNEKKKNNNEKTHTHHTGPILAGVGYSMGGIILSNYVSRLGPDCPLDVAVAVSGGLDMRYVLNFTRAQRLWQPILAHTLRSTFVVGKWGERVQRRLSSKSHMKHLLCAYHITDLDRTAIVAYNAHAFRDLDHYYSEMSALGDTPLDQHEHHDLNSGIATSNPPMMLPTLAGYRLQNLSIPLLVIHALDDPLISWRTVAANQGLMHPSTLTQWVPHGTLFILLTKRGGHVGWPLGWNPSRYKWKWMNDAASTFVDAYASAR